MTSTSGLVPGGVAELYADLNALPPFREGNGRAQRAFISLLCADSGVRLDWSTISAEGNVAALIAATHGDTTGFHAALRIAARQRVEADQSYWTEILRAET